MRDISKIWAYVPALDTGEQLVEGYGSLHTVDCFKLSENCTVYPAKLYIVP